MQTFKECQGCLDRSSDVKERFFFIPMDNYCDSCFEVKKDGKLYARLTQFDSDRLEEAMEEADNAG